MESGRTKIEQSSGNFSIVSGKLLELHARLTNEFDSKSSYFEGKVAKIRTDAYAGAVSGICGGPFGLIISYSIAAGIVEGQLIPELKKKLESVKNYYTNLQSTVDQTNAAINGTKEKLEAEVKSIGVMKGQTEATKFDIKELDSEDMKEFVVKDVNILIAQCNEYQTRHGKQN